MKKYKYVNNYVVNCRAKDNQNTGKIGCLKTLPVSC